MENFPVRNRIITGLSIGVLVVEARYRSGSSVTARYAISQNKELFCVPRDINQTTGYIANEFIKSGEAHLVTKPEDILEYYTYENERKVSEEYEEIYKYISDIPISIDEIYKFSSLSISGINEKLMFMEIEGIIKNVEGGYVRV